MWSSPGRCVVLLLLLGTLALPLRSQTPPAKQPASPPAKGPAKSDNDKKTGTSTPAESKKKDEPKKVDLSSLPADAIVVICERGEDLPLAPRAVILSPSKYQEMRDELERLRKQLQTDKPVPPTRCDLRGKVEGGTVRLEAEFSGTAEYANTLVALACPQAGVTSAQTDGRMALLRRPESGFVVRIDKPGEYHVKLELVLPLATREGSGPGFELLLPRAVITNLELDLPANSKDVRVGGRPLTDASLAGMKLTNHHLRGNPSLEPVEKLDVAWKEARPATGDLVRTAAGRIRVEVDAAGLTMEADLLLKASGPPTREWRLLVPLNAEVRIKSSKDHRLQAAIQSTDAPKSGVSLRRIELKEASADPLEVHVKARAQLPRVGSTVAVGPFLVFDAAQQTGTIVVRNQLRNLHLDYHSHGDARIRPRQTEESNGETTATLNYSFPLVETAKELPAERSIPRLDLEVQPLQAHVQTRVSHVLTLRSAAPAADEKGPGALHWDIVTTLTPATKWHEGESLKVIVPPQWQPSDDSGLVVAGGNPRSVTIPASLIRDGYNRDGYKLTGRYELPVKADGRAGLTLPRPAGTVERCDLKLEAPPDYEVLLNNAAELNLEASKSPRPNEQSWHCRNVTAEGPRLDVSWRPYRPELRVSAVVDVTLNGARGRVRHELRVQVPAVPPPFLGLRVPPGIGDSLTINGERQSARHEEGGPAGIRRIPVPAQVGVTEWKLELEYSTPLGDKDRPPLPGESFRVPLVTLEQATVGDVKVRVWSDLGLLPRVVNGPHWEERPLEEVAQRDLPVLVLHASRLDAPLMLRAREQTARFAVLVERSRVNVQLLENGVQNWHVVFQLRQLADRDLDVLMPGPVDPLKARFFLNHREINRELVNEEGEHTDTGNVARLRLSPELIRQTTLLEVSFQSQPGRTERSPLHLTLHPPRLLGAPAVAARWFVSVPPNRILLSPESGAGVERAWTRRGWLLASRLQRDNADLERGFDAALPDDPSLVCWQDQTAPIVLTQAPQQAWLLMCSLGLLIVGLGLYWAARPPSSENRRMAAWFWPLLAVLILAAALCTLFWPTLMTAILYGCEPGAIVLLSVVAVQWLMHQRYRRQIVFLPSFSRSRAGSSLLRQPAAQRAANGQPSTVDAPPPSGVGRQGDGS